MFVTNFPFAYALIALALLSIVVMLAARRPMLIVCGIASLCFLGYTYQGNAAAKHNFEKAFEKAKIERWERVISSLKLGIEPSSFAGTDQHKLAEMEAILMAKDYSSAWILLFVSNVLILVAGLVGTPRFLKWLESSFGFLLKRQV